MNVDIQYLPNYQGSLLKYETKGAAGFDLKAGINSPVSIGKNRAAVIPTGVKMAIPQGFELQIRPRSGLAAKKQISVLNAPGTVDSDYRGEVGVILYNHSDTVYTVQPGDRIAQAVLSAVTQIQFRKVKELSDTERGEGGFGSTGIN